MERHETTIITGDNELDELHQWLSGMDDRLDTLLSVKVRTSVHEIFTNISRHAYQNISGKPISLSLEITNNSVHIELSDKGREFTGATSDYFRQLPYPESGMGLYAARAAADNLQYTRTSDMTNRWILEFKYTKNEAK